ncbi:MAG: metallophosphoesterase [Bacilli bacterium]
MKWKTWGGIALAAATISFMLWENEALMTSKVVITNNALPKAFDGFVIAHLSDVHDAPFFEEIAQQTAESNPDVIVITGDLIDRSTTNVERVGRLTKLLTSIAPTYFVTGNHEAASPVYSELYDVLVVTGVKILDNAAIHLQKGEETLTLIGAQDPAFLHQDRINVNDFPSQYLRTNQTEWSVLLAHRPENVAHWASVGADLVLSGHAHGGQIRIPGVGGLIAPGQGLFPKYTSGVYTTEQTHMVVSRGIGNSIFPLRVMNRPEVVVVYLRNEEKKK